MDSKNPVPTPAATVTKTCSVLLLVQEIIFPASPDHCCFWPASTAAAASALGITTTAWSR
nr:hypothetical protein [Mycolicibacterium insubricum]